MSTVEAPPAHDLAALFELLGEGSHPSKSAVAAGQMVTIASVGGNADVTVSLGGAGDPFSFMYASGVPTTLGRGWRTEQWRDVRKIPTLPLERGKPPGHPGWGRPPAMAFGTRIRAPQALDLLKRYEPVVGAWPTRPELAVLRFGRGMVIGLNPYAAAWEPTASPAPLALPAAAFRAVRYLVSADGLPLELGLWEHGSAWRVGEVIGWSWDLDFPDLNIPEVVPMHVEATTAKELRKLVRAQPGEPLENTVPIVRVEYLGTSFNRAFLAAVGQHLDGAVTVEVPANARAPFRFTDEHGRTHVLAPML